MYEDQKMDCGTGLYLQNEILAVAGVIMTSLMLIVIGLTGRLLWITRDDKCEDELPELPLPIQEVHSFSNHSYGDVITALPEVSPEEEPMDVVV